MLVFGRNSATCLAALVVYIASLVAGGLHQHGHDAQHASAVTDQSALDSDSCPDSCTADCGQCTLCNAVHQAKTAPPAGVRIVHVAVLFAGLPLNQSQEASSLPRLSQARAPPIA
jgi:hypothetical protein